ncbi:MAG: hypothetical protein PHI34_07660 [Acidobacteriota bacterium]|nr:hypothetical protein [Acidobacteriota bacterium]
MPRPEPPSFTVKEFILFALLAGAIATFSLGYNYGLGNHIELLPHIERILDPSFAAGDFSVDSSAGGPRQYFARLGAVLAGRIPLPAVFFLLTLLQNAGTAVLTALAARKMFPQTAAAPILAVLAVMTIEGPRLGGAGFLRLPTAVAFTVATPLALAALWFGLAGRPMAALMAAVPAVFIHPLVGLEISSLGVAAASIERFGTALRIGRGGRERGSAFRGGLASLGALAALAVFAYVVWFRSQPPQLLDANSFIGLYARFRAPHHLWPAAFPPLDWIVAAIFYLAAAILAGRWIRRGPADRFLATRTVLVLGFLPIAAFTGWFFVQIVPLRLVTTLQLFRLTTVLKWLGYLLLAGAVGGLGRMSRSSSRARHSGLLALGSAAVLIASSLGRIGEADLPIRQQGLALGGIGLVAAAWLGPRRAWLRRLAPAVAAGMMIACLLWPASGRVPVIGGLLARTRPIFTLEQGAQREDAAARFCRERLPEGSTVVVPPLLGRFRLVSRRALLTDFKFMPTADAALIEWRRRLEAAYGPWSGAGFAAARSIDRGYRMISPARLARLRALYGVAYAVLYADTPGPAAEIYRDRFFKVVRIPAGP